MNNISGAAAAASPGRYQAINWLIFIGLSIVWGSSFALMKVGLYQLSPYEVAALRMLSAAIVLMPFTLGAIRRVPVRLRKLTLFSGLLGSFGPSYLFCIAETRIDSSLAGILNALTPLFTLIVGITFYQMKIAGGRWLGVLIGLAGLVMLPFSGPRGVKFDEMAYGSLVVIATIMYALNVNMVSRHLLGVASRDIAALAFSFLSIPSLLVLVHQHFFVMERWTYKFAISVGSVSALGIFGTALANIWFYTLVKRAGTLFGALVTYGIPLVAIGWGLLIGESVGLLQIGCLLIILLGVWMVNRRKAAPEST